MNREAIPGYTDVEARDETLTRFVSNGIQQAIHVIQSRYEENLDPLDNLSYHNSHHTLNVIRRTTDILTVIHNTDVSLVSKRDIQLGRLAAAFHDVDQISYFSQKDGTPIIQRERTAGESEEASIAAAHAFMREVNTEKSDTFDQTDFLIISEAIRATIPKFNGSTVTSATLSESSSPISLALSLADLNTAGIDNASQVIEESNALFKEQNIDILQRFLDKKSLSTDQLNEYQERLLKWYQFQITFVEGRKAEYLGEIAHLPENVRTNVSSLLSHFDTTIRDLKIEISKKEQSLSQDIISEIYHQSFSSKKLNDISIDSL